MEHLKAVKLHNDNVHLENTKIKGRAISSIWVVPTDNAGFEKVLDAAKNNKGPVLDFINMDYDDFEVIAVFDIEKFKHTEILEWEYLETLLNG